MQTPRKGVRWAFDVSNSPFGATTEPSTPETSTSSLAYVNSQIIAHGFARAPLDLSELAREEQNRVVKCVLGMLSQRVDDMGRAEDLSSRLRTLSYEHERLSNMLRASKSQILQAEREAEAARTKSNALTRDLSSASVSHTRTTNQLAHTTSALATLRSASIAETRKREQDVARLKERWQRLASEQARLGTVGSGLVCSNLAVVDGNEQYVGMKGEEVGEGAIRDAVEARERLTEENDMFREVLVKIMGVVRESLREKQVPDVKVPTPAGLFLAPSIEDDTGPALNAYRTLRDLIHQLAACGSLVSAEIDEQERELARTKVEAHRAEIKGWEERVEKLEREVARLTGELAASNDFAERGRILIEQMANDKKMMQKDIESQTAGEAASLVSQRQELEDERAKFTDAAIRLARERSEFEVERLQHAEEKRQWAMRQVAEVEAEEAARVSRAEAAVDSDVPMADPVLDVEPKAEIGAGKPGLGDALRNALKAAAEVENSGRVQVKEEKRTRERRSKVMKPSSPAKSKTGKRGREGSGTGREKDKEKKARSAGPSRSAPPPPVFTVTAPPAPPPVAPIPPTTPRSLHPAAQRAKARLYAPAVPSPLSRILTMAASPEGRGEGSKDMVDAKEDVFAEGLGETSSPKGGAKSPGRTVAVKSPGRVAGTRSPARASKGGGLAVKFAEAAAKEKTKGEKKTKEAGPPRTKDPAEKPKPGEPEAGPSKGKGKAVDEAREKDEGRDLDAIFAAPEPRAGPSGGGPSRAGSSKPMRVAVAGAPKRVLTPRKAAVGGVRAKRGATWKG